MPPKKTIPAGELTAPELRKLIRAHNILSKITIPKGTDREGLIKLIEGKNYMIDHKNKVIKPQVKRGKQITLKQAEELTKPKPVSEAVKKARAEKKKEQEEEKKKEIKIAKKEAVQEFKKKQKEAKKEIKKAEKLNAEKDLKKKSIVNNKKDMGETAFIKQQKKLQLQKQKETRRALLKSKPPVDKTTRRGKPVKKKELTLAEKKEKLKQLEKEASELEKKKSDKKEILKSEKKPVVKKPAVKKPVVKKAKGGDPINKLTGPEAEELWEKVKKLMPYDEGYAKDNTGKSHVGNPSAYNLKERKDLFKFFTSDKLPAREITKEQYEKLKKDKYQYSGLPSLYTQKITGVEKKEPKSYDKATWKFTTDKDKYMLLPQFFTDTIYGKQITKWDTKKARQIIEDYLKGDIGTKKKEVKKLEVKDFTIIMKGKNYNKEEFLKWVDTKGYKFSKQQLDKLNFLVSERGLQSFRHYYNSNGVLVLVPTLKFNASTKVYNPETKKYEEISIGEVLSELAGQRGGSVLKLELKPKVKIELTPEKIKEYDMTRLQFIKEELPSLKKNKKETDDKLEVYLKEYKEIRKDKNSPAGYSGSSGSLPFMRQLQESKAKDWLFKIETKYLGQGKKEENKLYIPQPIRDWYEKNVKDIQRLNLIVDNIYDTIKSYESKQKQLENKYR